MEFNGNFLHQTVLATFAFWILNPRNTTPKKVILSLKILSERDKTLKTLTTDFVSIFKFKGVFCLYWLKVWLQRRHHICFVPWSEFVLFYLLDSWETMLHINWRSKYQCSETIFFLGWPHHDILGSIIQVTKEHWTKCWPFFRKVWDCSCKFTLKGKL